MGAVAAQLCGPGLERILHTTDAKENAETIPEINYSSEQIGEAIKAALQQAAEWAEKSTASPGSFLNSEIHIPLPEQVEEIREYLKPIGFESKLADLEREINEAAEIASKGCAEIFTGSIDELTLEDATALLQDTNPHSATDFLKKECTEQLKGLMLPPVKKGMDESECGKIWKSIQKAFEGIKNISAAGGIVGMMSTSTAGGQCENKSSALEKKLPELNLNLETYIVNKGIEAIFSFISAKEEELRQDPMGSSSELVQGVFKRFSAQATTFQAIKGKE